MIVRGAHAVKHGEAPEFGGDLFLVEREDPRAALAEIVSLVSRRLPAHYGLDPTDRHPGVRARLQGRRWASTCSTRGCATR